MKKQYSKEKQSHEVATKYVNAIFEKYEYLKGDTIEHEEYDGIVEAIVFTVGHGIKIRFSKMSNMDAVYNDDEVISPGTYDCRVEFHYYAKVMELVDNDIHSWATKLLLN